MNVCIVTDSFAACKSACRGLFGRVEKRASDNQTEDERNCESHACLCNLRDLSKQFADRLAVNRNGDRPAGEVGELDAGVVDA